MIKKCYLFDTAHNLIRGIFIVCIAFVTLSVLVRPEVLHLVYPSKIVNMSAFSLQPLFGVYGWTGKYRRRHVESSIN